jgi:hypothetical protein
MLKAWTGTLCCTLIYGMYYRATWMGIKTRRIDFTKAVLR